MQRPVFSVSIHGTEELSKWFREFPEKVARRVINAGLKKAAQPAFDVAQNTMRRREETGQIADYLKIKKIPGRKTLGYMIESTGAKDSEGRPYEAHVEFGHKIGRRSLRAKSLTRAIRRTQRAIYKLNSGKKPLSESAVARIAFSRAQKAGQGIEYAQKIAAKTIASQLIRKPKHELESRLASLREKQKRDDNRDAVSPAPYMRPAFDETVVMARVILLEHVRKAYKR